MTYGTVIMNLIVAGTGRDTGRRTCCTGMTYGTIAGRTYTGTMIYRCMDAYVKGAMTVATSVWTGVAGSGTNQYTITIMTSGAGVMNFIVTGVGRDCCGAARCTGMTAVTVDCITYMRGMVTTMAGKLSMTLDTVAGCCITTGAGMMTNWNCGCRIYTMTGGTDFRAPTSCCCCAICCCCHHGLPS